jgi:protoporphyrinogen oxidase
MAPPGKTLVVAEFFSFQGDPIWNQHDGRLADMTIENLERLGFIQRNEVLDCAVVRVPKAYPLFEVGYREHVSVINEYLGRFKNLHITGRSGMFQYYNMDVAIKSGIETAEKIIRQNAAVDEGSLQKPILMNG